MRDLQDWGAAPDNFEQAPPPGSEWAQTNTPSQQAASAGPLVCIICHNQVRILLFSTAQVHNRSNFHAVLSPYRALGCVCYSLQGRQKYAAADKIHHYA